MDDLDPVELEIDGVLDLHTFNPKEVRRLIPDYLEACLEKDIFAVRIIHGKGKGVLRRTVHSILEQLAIVVSFKLAGEDGGSWGATLVELQK
nr:Smr/MutS family protein [Desulfobulbaceae bacterium]